MRAHLAAIGCNGQEISRAHLAAIGCNGLNAKIPVLDVRVCTKSCIQSQMIVSELINCVTS